MAVAVWPSSMKWCHPGSVSMSSITLSTRSTSRRRNDWNGRYHSRSQWLCGTMWSVTSLMGGDGRGAIHGSGYVPLSMATYIMLSQLSPDGANTLLENPERLKQVNAEVEGMGAKVLAQYAVLGPYDFVTILESDDAPSMSTVALQLGARGTLKTITLAAVPVDEFIANVKKATSG